MARERQRQTLKLLLQGAPETEMVELVAASRYRRTEVCRRTRPMSCLTNDASCERIIYAVISHLDRSWEGRLLPEFLQK